MKRLNVLIFNLSSGAAISAATLVLTLSAADAATLTASSFVYDGGAMTVATPPMQRQSLSALWNPRDMPGFSVKSPRVRISFFGYGLGCSPTATNGPVTPLPLPMAANAENLTGIAPDPIRHDLSWVPTPDLSACHPPANTEPGPAFIVANEQRGGGLGLFSYTGNARFGASVSFWHEFTSKGQNGSGSNSSIQGTFVAWTFNWKAGAIAPWTGSNSEHDGGPHVMIRTVQVLPTANVLASDPGLRPTQLNQHYGVTFVNATCMATVSSKRACQVRLLFQAMIMRGGKEVWRRAPWANRARLLLDPAQGGLPVLIGPLKARGELTVAGPPYLDVWRSAGSQTLSVPFRETTFAADVSFRQFRNGLLLIASRLLSVPIQNVSAHHLKQIFGAAWNTPGSWLLADVNVGQEVHNLDPQHPASMGGALKCFEVSPVR